MVKMLFTKIHQKSHEPEALIRGLIFVCMQAAIFHIKQCKIMFILKHIDPFV